MDFKVSPFAQMPTALKDAEHVCSTNLLGEVGDPARWRSLAGSSRGNCSTERQDLLKQDFFFDPAQCRKKRADLRIPGCPDFGLKTLKESSVDSQLPVWNTGITRPPPIWVVGNDAGPRGERMLKAGLVTKRWEEGDLKEAVEALDLLVERRCHLTDSLLYRVLRRCMAQKDLVLGRRIHAVTSKSGQDLNTFIANHIIRMYASHGKVVEAMLVFTKVAAPDCYMWASIIMAHAEHGQAQLAIELYRQMCNTTVKPNSYIFVAVLKACATAVDLATGKQVHDDLRGSGLEFDIFIGNSLVNMYAKCGSLEDSRRVFDTWPVRNVVTWNSMIAGYAQNGHGKEALAIYIEMQQDGLTPADQATFVCLLQTCTRVKALDQGKQLHAQIQQQGLEADMIVGSCLVDMYAKCGSLVDARIVFDRLPARNVVTWTAMLAGYAQNGLGQEALALYSDMQDDCVTPTDHTFVCLLKACANVGALSEGKEFHAQIQSRGLEGNAFVGNCLVDMYAKCGSLEDARRVFDNLSAKDVVTWNALLNGYAEHSDGPMAMQCFEEMCRQGYEPNETTFICLLVACSHAGLVHEGQRYFKMIGDRGIVPTLSHYNTMVDVLARSGHLDEAETLLQTMPFENDVVGWTSLLSACKSRGDIHRGNRCFNRLIALEPEDASGYVLMGSIYANAGMWRDVDRIESLRKFAGARKKPAKACIEVQHQVHKFTVGEERADVSSRLRSVNLRLKEEGGHVPQTELVLKALSESEKEDSLCGHAEKLALAYGLLNTPEGTTLLVTKDLRMCNDCHSSTKILAQLEKREIIVRDAHRVHHFMNGSCSCGDRH